MLHVKGYEADQLVWCAACQTTGVTARHSLYSRNLGTNPLGSFEWNGHNLQLTQKIHLPHISLTIFSLSTWPSTSSSIQRSLELWESNTAEGETRQGQQVRPSPWALSHQAPADRLPLPRSFSVPYRHTILSPRTTPFIPTLSSATPSTNIAALLCFIVPYSTFIHYLRSLPPYLPLALLPLKPNYVHTSIYLTALPYRHYSPLDTNNTTLLWFFQRSSCDVSGLLHSVPDDFQTIRNSCFPISCGTPLQHFTVLMHFRKYLSPLFHTCLFVAQTNAEGYCFALLLKICMYRKKYKLLLESFPAYTCTVNLHNFTIEIL